MPNSYHSEVCKRHGSLFGPDHSPYRERNNWRKLGLGIKDQGGSCICHRDYNPAGAAEAEKVEHNGMSPFIFFSRARSEHSINICFTKKQMKERLVDSSWKQFHSPLNSLNWICTLTNAAFVTFYLHSCCIKPGMCSGSTFFSALKLTISPIPAQGPSTTPNRGLQYRRSVSDLIPAWFNTQEECD